MDIKSSGVQGTVGGAGSYVPYMEKAEVNALLLIGEEMWVIWLAPAFLYGNTTAQGVFAIYLYWHKKISR